MNPKLNIGLVGFGISAKIFHIPFITSMQEYNLKAVVERSRNESREKFPSVTIVRDIDELLKDKTIDLVVITTPNETHFPYAKKTLEAGRHVVLEKPFTITSKEAKDLIDVAHKSKKILTVYQNRRYVTDFLTIKEIVNKKLLGEIHEFEAHYDRYRAEAKPNAWREEPKSGSGVLYDLGSHLIDQAVCLFGLPKTMTADIRMQRPHSKVDDYFDLRFDYGFLKIILKAGMLVREPGPRYMLHGTKGSFIKSGEDPQEALLKEGHSPTQPGWATEPEEYHGLLHTEIEGSVVKQKYRSLPGNFGQFYKNLYDTIINGSPLKEKPEHGYNTIRLIEIAFESSKKKCAVDCEGLMEVDYD